MEAERIWQDLMSLPPEARQQVLDLITTLKAQYAAPSFDERREHRERVLNPHEHAWLRLPQ